MFGYLSKRSAKELLEAEKLVPEFMEFMQKIGELLSLKINFYGASFSIFDFAIWYLFATLVIWIVKQLLF